MTVKIGMAKEILLDDHERGEYDRVWTQYNRSGKFESDFAEDWEDQSDRVKQDAENLANATLEFALTALAAVVIVTATGAAYAWEGSEKFAGRDSSLNKLQYFWAGFAGWLCVICLAVPGTSICTFICFYWAFFHEGKFIGMGNLLKGMFLLYLFEESATPNPSPTGYSAKSSPNYEGRPRTRFNFTPPLPSNSPAVDPEDDKKKFEDVKKWFVPPPVHPEEDKKKREDVKLWFLSPPVNPEEDKKWWNVNIDFGSAP